MKLFLALLFGCVFCMSNGISQCAIQAVPMLSSVFCYDSNAVFVINTSSAGYSIVDFNSSTIPAGWSASAAVTFNNPCSPSLDGSPTLWFGADPGPRVLETTPYDFSCGGSVCFSLDYAGDENNVECDDPDLGNEGVYFEYSTDNGVNWFPIHFFQPTSGYVGVNYIWSNHCFELPVAAWSSATKFRWDQQSFSAANFDNWGVDNIIFAPNNCGGPAYYYLWDGILGDQDSSFWMSTPTSFNIEYTNGVDDTCATSVSIAVEQFDPGFYYDSSAYCGVGPQIPVSLTGDTGGIFTSTPTGLAINQFGTIFPSTSTPGSYAVNYSSTNDSCLYDSTWNITIYTDSAVYAGTDTTVCEFDLFTLTADNPHGLAISWNNGVTDGAPFMPTPGTTEYIVTFNPGSACSNSDTVLVTASGVPIINAGNDTLVQSGLPFSLNAYNPNGAGLQWTGGVTDGVPFSLSAGVYEFILTATLGCSATDTIEVTVVDPPTISAIVIDDNGTASGSIDATITTFGGPVSSILWSNSAITEDISNLTAGNYSITVIDSVGLQGSNTFTVESSAGINNTESEQILIYPNPTSQVFTLECSGNFKITILDARGRIVYQGDGKNKLLIDSNEWSKGIYVIELIQNNKLHTKKLIVE